MKSAAITPSSCFTSSCFIPPSPSLSPATQKTPASAPTRSPNPPARSDTPPQTPPPSSENPSNPHPAPSLHAPKKLLLCLSQSKISSPVNNVRLPRDPRHAHVQLPH